MKKSAPVMVFILFFFLSEASKAQNTTREFKVGVVLDLDKLIGKMALSSMALALEDFYAYHSSYKTRLILHTRDSIEDVVGAASAAIDLLKNVEVQAIIGPVTSQQANFMVDLGSKSQVPIISFSATSPSISPSKTPYFIRTALNDSSQVQAISSIVKAFGWRNVVLIYEDTEYGSGIIPYLIDAFQEIDTQVPYRIAISPTATDDRVLKELYKLKTMQTRVFILHTAPSLGSNIFLKAKEAGMMSEGYSWIITDGLANFLNSRNSYVIDSMQGVLGVRPYVPRSKDLDKFRAKWKRRFIQENPDMVEIANMNIFALWAYDTVSALANAVEKVGTWDSIFLKSKSRENSSDISLLGVSQIGPKLLQIISISDYHGLSGEFSLVDGQLQSHAFQILNVVGHEEREIGIWTPKNGILRDLNKVDKALYSTSKDNLGTIIWPGESTRIPKGWTIPTSGKRLRIGVPFKSGFSEFVKVTWDTKTNSWTTEGYCIDVFNAVMEALPYAVPYDFIPFVKDGESAGNYDDLIYEVYIQNFDAVVGDTTIVANRSQYVDFALPYTESGVTMIVPIREDVGKNAWIFLRPLNWDLWLTSGGFFVFTGFVIWVLEHRINDDFRGPHSHQLGTIFWFSFSTLVFSHRERVVSNLARFVVIVWIFVVLILTSSYTASLTSMLTVQRLEPTITDIQQLIKNHEKVGYQYGSFVLGLLKRMKINDSQLKVYNSLDELDEALSKGSQKGGVAAAFDEIPYIKLLLGKFCSKYTMVGPTYKTDGFGFAFPRGSPLVPDISRAILDVTQGERMVAIEQYWFGTQRTCPDPNTMVSSNSLTLNSFLGLFLIAGVSSGLALLGFSAVFLYNHKHIWSSCPPDASTWERIVAIARHFDSKDLSSHTFRKSGIIDNAENNAEAVSAVASPNVILGTPPSLWNSPNQVEENTQSMLANSGLDNSNQERVTGRQETNPSVELSSSTRLSLAGRTDGD